MQRGGHLLRRGALDRLPAGHAPPVHRRPQARERGPRGAGAREGPRRGRAAARHHARQRRLRVRRHVHAEGRVRHAGADVAHGPRPRAAAADDALVALPGPQRARLLARARRAARQPGAVPHPRAHAQRGGGPLPGQAGRLWLLAARRRAVQRGAADPPEPRLARAELGDGAQAVRLGQRPVGARHRLRRGGVRPPRAQRVHDDPGPGGGQRPGDARQPAHDLRGRPRPDAQAHAARAGGPHHRGRGALPPVL
mmetsp:Transcript_41277/g.132726  ORF Transcript_41277/g.132726 Transcript_41277/m.132726 type:complete len:253 (+) Transcript_41277:571-1329(+)